MPELCCAVFLATPLTNEIRYKNERNRTVRWVFEQFCKIYFEECRYMTSYNFTRFLFHHLKNLLTKLSYYFLSVFSFVDQTLMSFTKFLLSSNSQRIQLVLHSTGFQRLFCVSNLPFLLLHLQPIFQTPMHSYSQKKNFA